MSILRISCGHEPNSCTHLAFRPGANHLANVGQGQKPGAARGSAGADHSAGRRWRRESGDRTSGFASRGPPCNCGANVFWPCARKDCRKTRLVRVAFLRFPTIRSPRLWRRRCTVNHRTPRTGAHDGWPRRKASAKQRCDAFGSGHGLKPHRISTFKVSRDPQFVQKLIDVVGLYLNPPDKALVFCMDEKSQIQALDRTQPGLPLKPGRCGTMTHDYKRHGTTTLFAAQNTLDGKVIGDCMPQHRHQVFIRFLKHIDQETPREFELHLIMDNYATRKHASVKRWLRRNSRFHLHFTPTSSSWLNLVERWFRDLTQQRLRRGSFHHVTELIRAISDYID